MYLPLAIPCLHIIQMKVVLVFFPFSFLYAVPLAAFSESIIFPVFTSNDTLLPFSSITGSSQLCLCLFVERRNVLIRGIWALHAGLGQVTDLAHIHPITSLPDEFFG